MFTITTATRKVSAMSQRIRAVQGGTSASKTISILLWLIQLAQTDTKATLTSIVAESFPHLRRGAMRDFLTIMQTHGYFKEGLWDKTNSVYTFETGSQIEFFSVDQSEKVRGARRDRLFINEASNISFGSFEELEVRTREFIYLDWNPTNSFWFYEEVQKKRKGVEHIILTYLDNEALEKTIVDSIEDRKSRRGWWQVYGLGQLGEVDGKIYKDWQIIDDIPHEARLERYGLDFGYTNDPTAVVAVYYYNGGYILDEIVFQKGLSNKQIADTLSNIDKALIIADSAEPKSIDEIRQYGLNILPCEKGKDSVRNGISLVQDQKISMTKRSVNIIKEYRNYLWQTDKQGMVINVPEAGFDHACFTKDTLISLPAGSIISQKSNGVKDVYEFMGSKVTADHPYLTQRGFILLDAIRYDDRIVLWKNKLLMEFHLDGTQNLTAPSFVTILHLLRRNVSAIKLNVSTGIYGKNPMGLFLKVFMSTTKTVTLLITTYLTSNVYHLKITIKDIIQRCYLNGVKILRGQLNWQASGQKLKRDNLSGVFMGNSMLNTFQDTKSPETAITAEKNTLQKNQMENGVIIIAKLKHCGKEEVFSTVTTSGFFTANGVVVSNCDALRYALTSILKVGTPSFSELREVEENRYARTTAKTDYGL